MSNSSPPTSPTPIAASTPIVPGSGRSRGLSLSQTTADEKREREQERQRASEVHGPLGVASEVNAEGGEITPRELRAEMETLLSLRRRSLSQPTALDPDLPPLPPVSPTLGARPVLSIHTGSLSIASVDMQKSPTAPAAAETGTLVRRISTSLPPNRLPSDHPLPNPLAPLSSPPLTSPYSPPHDGATAAHSSQDLFWLPASLHPELAPKEFKAFIREQTRPANLARRVSMSGEGSSSGFGSGRVERKKSMLRGEYIPGRGDGVGERGEALEPAMIQRKATNGGRVAGRLNFDELTIKDLQRLEELAARAEAEGFTDGENEGDRLGRVLRRSLSLNPTHVAAAAAAGAHLSTSPLESPDVALAADSPLVVHIPGQILRRSARTKIRKAGLVGDGGGHRFGPSRRVRSVSGSGIPDDPGTATDSDQSVGDLSLEGADTVSLDGHGSTFDSVDSTLLKEDDIDPQINLRHSSSSDASQDFHIPIEHIEDIQFDDFSLTPHLIALPASPISPSTPVEDLESASSETSDPTTPQPAPSSADYDWSTHQQQQQSAPYLPPVSATSSPSTSPTTSTQELVPTTPVAVPAIRMQIPSPTPTVREIEKKKSGWARLGLSIKGADEDVSKRKKGKGKETESNDGPRRVSWNSNLQEQNERRAPVEKEKEKETSSFFGGLFGKRRTDVEASSPTTSPPATASSYLAPPPPPATASGVLGPNGRYTNFYRLPIHVERAVYRLSHIKLANPRRPLYEQVLISNIMYWYLSVINKPTPPPLLTNVTPPASGQGHAGAISNHQMSESIERDRERERHGEREPRKEGAREKRPGMGNKNAGRQLGRSAEQPMKTPTYDSRQIEEYSTLPLSNSQPSHRQEQQQQQQQHGRSASSPSMQTQNSNRRSPDRSSAPADYYRRSSPSPPSSPTQISPSRSYNSLNQEYQNSDPLQREARENLGFQVTSRKEASKSDQSRSRPVSVRRTLSGDSDGFEDFIEAYSGYSPPISPILEPFSENEYR